MFRIPWRTASAVAVFGIDALAQGPAFQTPGMSSGSYAQQGSGADSGQANRFSSVFNPAFSFVVDAIADETHFSGMSDDGTHLELRSLEMAAQSWVDPSAWAYFIAASDGDTLNVEEAAIHYTGLGGNNKIRAGRFFIDFGKQMQTHVHELRTIERPLVLRTFLGDEVKGDGVQWDDWTSIGEKTAVRWSIGVFNDLLPEQAEDFDAATQASPSVADRKHIDNLNFTARLTAFADVSERGVLQIGTSARLIPEYALTFAPSGDEARGLENGVYGVDATYGWTSDTGLQVWTFGGEYLIDTGDTFASIDDAGTPGNATDDLVHSHSKSLNGFLAFGDYAWDRENSAGLQLSYAELPEAGAPDATEYTVYFTHSFSEFQRLRLELSAFDRDDGEDSVRLALQYTAIVGAHGHGVNW